MSVPAKKPSVETEVVTALEARTILHCSKEFLYKEIRSGRLRSFLRGKNRMFNLSSLKAYMAMAEAEGLNPDGTPRIDGWR